MIVESIGKRFGDKVKVKERRDGKFDIYVNPDMVLPLISFLKTSKFEHLTFITCVDWIKEKEFELVYNLFSYETREEVFVKVRVNREKPEIESIIPVYDIAETYEREIHEMFGVYFAGNDNLTPIFLEDWKGPPPMRKDFDALEYSNEKYEVKNG